MGLSKESATTWIFDWPVYKCSNVSVKTKVPTIRNGVIRSTRNKNGVTGPPLVLLRKVLSSKGK